MPLQWPQKSKKWSPRPPKVTKMGSKQVPEIIKIRKNLKKWNLTKTIVFCMFLGGWDIRNQRFFQLKIIKNRACNPNMLFDASNHINYGKVTPKWSQQVTQKSSKIDENQCWDIQGPSWVHPCTQWSPKWCQSGDPRPKNASKIASEANKINIFECKSIWNQFSTVWFVNASLLEKIINSWNSAMIPILQIFQILQIHSDCKLQICWLPEGPAAGAKP